MIRERLKKERSKKKISQQKLADIIGVSQQTIGSWETGRTEPDQESIKKLANFFNVTTDYLLGREYNNNANKILETVKENPDKYKETKKLLERKAVNELLDYLEDKDDDYVKLVLDIALRIEEREKNRKTEENS